MSNFACSRTRINTLIYAWTAIQQQQWTGKPSPEVEVGVSYVVQSEEAQRAVLADGGQHGAIGAERQAADGTLMPLGGPRTPSPSVITQ